jgi:hypothetical protein
MSKPEIQPLVAFISCRSQVVDSFSLSHGIPLSIPRLISPHVVNLGHDVQPDVAKTDGD